MLFQLLCQADPGSCNAWVGTGNDQDLEGPLVEGSFALCSLRYIGICYANIKPPNLFILINELVGGDRNLL
jgi:hypothetical protein